MYLRRTDAYFIQSGDVSGPEEFLQSPIAPNARVADYSETCRDHTSNKQDSAPRVTMGERRESAWWERGVYDGGKEVWP